MRLWSIHPRYLDAKGLVALWREALLAQKVLKGETRGYRNHPQLARFASSANPSGAIASYLRAVADEADSRGYNFDRSKINPGFIRTKMEVATGQMDYEIHHLKKKLKIRDESFYQHIVDTKSVQPHPLFRVVNGPVAKWEKT